MKKSKQRPHVPREEIVDRVCSAFNLKIEDLGVELDTTPYVNVGSDALRCSVSQKGIVQIESRRPRWEIEFDEAAQRARIKYGEEYFKCIDLEAMRERAEERMGKRGQDFIRVFRVRVNPHQRQLFSVEQTKHANDQTEKDVNGVLGAPWS
jgi:hypothetical protein